MSNVTFQFFNGLSKELESYITSNIDRSEWEAVAELCLFLNLTKFKDFYDVTTISAAKFEEIALPFARENAPVLGWVISLRYSKR